jgi:type II secretion system protein J
MNCSPPTRIARRRSPRGFTLIEVLIAGIITAFLLGTVVTSLAQISAARNIGKQRFDAHMRADSALSTLRRDIASVIRTDDLFYTRLRIVDEAVNRGEDRWDRDEILTFNTRVRPMRTLAFLGEGIEYETQFRVSEDDGGPVLWQRRDAMPDEFDLGGGKVTPLVEGIVSLSLEAYDGLNWFDEWDSDDSGLPLAVRVTVIASGNREGEDPYNAPLATLRTVVPIDRVAPPADLFAGLDPELPPVGEGFTDAAAGADPSQAGQTSAGQPPEGAVPPDGVPIDPATGRPFPPGQGPGSGAGAPVGGPAGSGGGGPGGGQPSGPGQMGGQPNRPGQAQTGGGQQ